MRVGPLGVWELLIILVVVLLIFGPRRLPEMAKGIGQSVREFRKGIRDMKDDFESEVNGDEKPTRAKPAVYESTAERESLESERAQLQTEKEALRKEREGINA